jgi:eukaryotic-like serine/threonine-protein kinase
MAKDRDTRWGAALLLSRIGDSGGAEKILPDLAKTFPHDTILNSVWIPVARALAQTHANNPVKAVELLESARPYELGIGPNSCGAWPLFYRAQAYLLAHDGQKAAAEYQRIIDHRGVDPGTPIQTLSGLGLARAYALQGDSAKARTAYQDFIAVWKDADTDVLVLKQAKAEYAKLQ